LVHGASYFSVLLHSIEEMWAGDLLLFTDWRGDPDERLAGPGTEVSTVLADAARRGVVVKGLVWRSHLDRFTFSEQENRHLGEEIDAAGGECLRDMRVRPGGSHHQKFVVLRHPRRPERDIAFAGGIDLCHSRSDDAEHNGDPQAQPMAAIYGSRPPWHDIQLAVRGPAVADIETCFRERWNDPAPLTRNPINVVSDLLRRDDHRRGVLPPALPDPAPAGSSMVQEKVISRAHKLIYLEDQYLWNTEITACFADVMQSNPDLRLIAVIPHYPDQDGRISEPMNLVGRQQALDQLHDAGGDRVAVYGIENSAGTPIYVHAKVCIVDDLWASIGSDNVNRRSWTHDSELCCAVIDETADPRAPRSIDKYGHGARQFARNLRLELAREHLGRRPDDDADLVDPITAFSTFAATARALSEWVAGGRIGPRPPGQLRPYATPQLSRSVLLWADPLYRVVADPDGRPRFLRRGHRF
jgi:phosphatidylserine/phosphatidylglycerophosphate/cardiolipin synthase-like enzyme